MANYSQNQSFCGLGTVTIKVPEAGRYAFDGKISIPMVSQGSGASSLLVVINKNGSPQYTGGAGAQGFYANILCAANDTITIVLSSSDQDDIGLNVIKTTIAVSESGV